MSQRTGMESPAALMKRNAFRPWNVLLSNREETGFYRMDRTTPPSTRSAAPLVAEARGLHT